MASNSVWGSASGVRFFLHKLDCALKWTSEPETKQDCNFQSKLLNLRERYTTATPAVGTICVINSFTNLKGSCCWVTKHLQSSTQAAHRSPSLETHWSRGYRRRQWPVRGASQPNASTGQQQVGEKDRLDWVQVHQSALTGASQVWGMPTTLWAKEKSTDIPDPILKKIKSHINVLCMQSIMGNVRSICRIQYSLQSQL